MNTFTSIIADRLGLEAKKVENTLTLLEEGCTIPFISRYRKEKTGGLDEVMIGEISEWRDRLTELTKRKETVCKTIDEQGKITEELKRRIDETWDAATLEDIYLPYKPKRRTRAQIAREQGLEPLSQLVMLQREQDIEGVARRFVKGDVKDVTTALKGAQDIIAETVSENEQSRRLVRGVFSREAVITSKVVPSKKEEDGAAKYADYFDLSEPLRRCPGNRLLAMRRGENEGFLRVSISIDSAEVIERLQRHYVKGSGKCAQFVSEAVEDVYKRLIEPSVENEFAAASKEKADEEAIGVFAENLRQLLLAAPLGRQRVMGVDPGIRTGCKVVCLDEQGNLLFHDVVYPFPPHGNRLVAQEKFGTIALRYDVQAIAVGNGTASRETADILRSLSQGGAKLPVYVVSEDGASVYSASKIAREEFPNEDVTVRGAVSIGRD